MTPGTRIRVKRPCVWPERAGCTGVVVAPPNCGTYPHPGPGELVILLDGDPLGEPSALTGGGFWSCVIGVNDVEPLVAAGGDT